MPALQRSEQEEADFMNKLLLSVDTTNSVTSCSKSAARRTGQTVPHGPSTAKTPSLSSAPLPEHSTGNRSSSTELRTPTKEASAEDVDVAQLLQGAEDWDWDDMNSDFLSPKKDSPKKTAATSGPPRYNPETCTRCVVKEIFEESPHSPFQKILIVDTVTDNQRLSVTLKDDWADTDIRTGDIINIIGDFTESSAQPTPSITISSKQNLLVLQPDLLITATSLSTAPQCRRKPLVSNLVRGSVDVTPSLIWGNLLHEVMQACLTEERWDQKWIEQTIAEIVRKNLGELLRINIGVEQAITEVKARAIGLRSFSEKYIAQKPKPDALLTNTRATQGQTSLLAISQLHDIEEDIWSPTYGIKGKVDASVQALISDSDTSLTDIFGRSATTQSWVMPFEIKTGRPGAGMEHRAQTMLYTLLMAERYCSEVPSGLLYYTRSDEVVRVPAVRNEVRALIVARNEMAAYMMRRIRFHTVKSESKVSVEDGAVADVEDTREVEPFLPPTIDDSWQCGKCYALNTCMLYRKAVENVEDTTSPIADIYALKTSHLTKGQCAFFKHWEALISLEEQDLVRFKKELWTMGAEERERHGRCFANMTLDTTYTVPSTIAAAKSQKESKIHRFTYCFTKSSSLSGSLLNGHISCGDAITISVEPDLLAIARGFIVDLSPHEVVVGVDHELNLDTISARLRSKNAAPEKVAFRIDKDELFGGMGRMRDNLAQLFYLDGDTRRLQLVVDLIPPRFHVHEPPPSQEIQSSLIAHLNDSQKAAMTKVLTAQDYALILGMPGTGKTTVIAAIIRSLVSMGKTVLLASYTHSAVDTILLKLKDVADFGILRLGNLDKIHSDVHDFTLSRRRTATSLEQLEHQIMAPPVVATTCLSIDQSVRNRAARKGGLDVSLFRRLSDAHPNAVVDLTEQYRMNADIMALSNKLIYSDRLRCGSEAVATRSLVVPNRPFLRGLHTASGLPCQRSKGGCWLSRLLDERCKAVFVDTDAVPARDSPVGDLVENQVEARLVYQVAECLIGSGVTEDKIGVLSLYRQQTKLLSYLLQGRPGVEILTADRSQGRDKECILISMVRSNEDGQVGDLMKDWRRMNVSLTRARSKLIIFGSRQTLQNTPLLREFFELMEEKAWILRLPPNAHEMHASSFVEQRPNKRPAEDSLSDISSSAQKENTGSKPLKRGKRPAVGEGILKGRPMLRDLVNATR
ncbi:Dna2-domain-containing protein [Laetiporus sulphureus 93-53]|uniref:DNA replication ATP-dependent helicase/nuclease DNA2 n=1 Tax=Laetiporus sulphureus 93-53 TaxID=1314785 RepID=A0A165B1W3_9APHY|nr:Dna2-domain-containing protein [Laetiporus sulphureus 93-53]KZT00075.1 Dna2-domain-containing protein [Laetiporus sulphureus 93-53]